MKAKAVQLADVINKNSRVIQVMVRHRHTVVCRHRKTGRLKRMLFRALYDHNKSFWKSEAGTWQYYLEKDEAEEILQLASAEQRARALDLTIKDGAPPAAPQTDAPGGPRTGDDGGGEEELLDELEPIETEEHGGANFGESYERITSLNVRERTEGIRKHTNRLEELARAEAAEPEEVAEALVSASESATLSNRATINEAIRMGNEQARQYTEDLVKETRQLVKSTTKLLNADLFDESLVNAVVQKSNGTVLRHMTRVFLNGLDFLLFYNRQVLTRGIANRIRVKFAKQYKERYRYLLPHLHEDHVTLERVFLGGMKSLDEVELNKFATGFLVHDVGKAEDIEYHEGEAAYDRETVVRHVKIGYRAVMEKTSYPREAALITGYHHEYYGNPAGYGYFREFLDGYKQANPEVTQDYVMAYTMEPLLDYEVIAYFPAKMLEIVDIFDSLTDKDRKYRQPLSESGAIEMMRNEFLGQNLKIDPILFDIFLDFVEEKRGRR